MSRHVIDIDLMGVYDGDIASLLGELRKEMGFFIVMKLSDRGEDGFIDINVYGIEDIDEPSEAWMHAVKHLVWKHLKYFVRIDASLTPIPEDGSVFVFDDEGEFDALCVEEAKNRPALRLVDTPMFLQEK